MQDFLTSLESIFTENANPVNAEKQKAYMRNQFAFYGLTANIRRDVVKPFLIKEYLPQKIELHTLVKTLWEKPEREYQMFAMDLVFKYVKKFEKNDMALLEYMVTHKSWWDTVDMIAVKLMGGYFKLYPEDKQIYVAKWLNSGNMWLQRSALLFQLKYKTEIDTDLLAYCITPLLGSKEFFINKAIGWVLREYSRTNPSWVIQYAKQTDLAPLSRKEALRLLK